MENQADVERALICALFGKAKPECYAATGLLEEHFTLPAHRALWGCALMIAAQARAPTLGGVLAMCRARALNMSAQDWEVVQQISDNLWSSNLDHTDAPGLVAAIISIFDQQSKIEALEEAQRRIQEGSEPDVDALQRRLSRRTGTATENQVSRYLASIKKVWSGDAPSVVIPTCLASLNSFIGGGWRRKKIHTVSARPGHGKSSFVEQDFFFQMRKEVRALYLPVEMGAEAHIESIVKREYWDQLARVGALSYEHAKMTAIQQQEVERCIIDFLSMNPLVEEPESLTFSNGPWLSLVERHRPDVVYVDYVQKLHHSERTAKTAADMELLLNNWLSVAKKLNCAVVLVAQFNRYIEHQDKNKPQRKAQMSDVADSSELEKLASIMLVPLWGDDDEAEMQIMKCRWAQAGTACHLGLDRKKRKLFDL